MNATELKTRHANGRWPDILARVAKMPRESMDGKHGSCPSCGGTDRFRVFRDFIETGGVICNQCGKKADGFAVIQWLNGCGFQESMRLVADFLGVDLKAKGKGKAKKPFHRPAECISYLSPGNRHTFARSFSKAKAGCEVKQIMRCNFIAGLWPSSIPRERRMEVLAFVSYDPTTWSEHSFALYRRDGSKFPAYESPDGKVAIAERKLHILPGSESGTRDGLVIVGTVEEFKDAKTIWKEEGITDAITCSWILPALCGMVGDDTKSIAVANICGAESFPATWGPAFRGKDIVIVGDNDPDGKGEKGARKAAEVLV